jgi:hypothetical protein
MRRFSPKPTRMRCMRWVCSGCRCPIATLAAKSGSNCNGANGSNKGNAEFDVVARYQILRLFLGRSAKIRRSQPAFRQCQRPTCSLTSTGVPWIGRSCRETPIAAMARARNGLATRTDSRVLAVSLYGPTLVYLEHAAKRHVAQIGEGVCVR